MLIVHITCVGLAGRHLISATQRTVAQGFFDDEWQDNGYEWRDGLYVENYAQKMHRTQVLML